MPDKSFENEARKMADGFRMDPQPAVWRQVEAAIRTKKKRRFLIWWWLLPLCLAGGSALVLFRHQTPESSLSEKKTVIEKRDTIFQKDAANTISSNRLQQQSNHVLPKANENLRVIEKKTSTGIETAGEPFTNEAPKEIQTGAGEEVWLTKRNADRKTDSALRLENGQTRKGSINTNSENETAGATAKAEMKSRTDSVRQNQTHITTATDSLLQTNTAAVSSRKPGKTKAWHWGAVLETGYVSRGRNPLANGLYSVPSYLNNASNADASGRPVSISRRANRGKYLMVSAAAEKKLGSRFFIRGELGYRYQSMSLLESYRVDTAVSSPNNNSSYVYYTTYNTQHLHYATAYTGIGWQVASSKKTAISLAAGIDNSILVFLSSKNQLPDSLKRAAATNLYRLQPFLTTSVSFRLQTGGNSRLEVAPVARFGLHKMEKNTGSFRNNHVITAGVRAIYFFR